MTFSAATRILGISKTARKDYALKMWKMLTVKHTLNGNEEVCKILSQAKEAVKRHYPSRCVDCGVSLSSSGKTRCMMHHHWFKNYGKSLKQ